MGEDPRQEQGDENENEEEKEELLLMMEVGRAAAGAGCLKMWGTGHQLFPAVGGGLGDHKAYTHMLLCVP